MSTSRQTILAAAVAAALLLAFTPLGLPHTTSGPGPPDGQRPDGGPAAASADAPAGPAAAPAAVPESATARPRIPPAGDPAAPPPGADHPAAGTPATAPDGPGGGPGSVLYLWTGDEGAAGADSPAAEGKHYDVVDGEDFLAVVDTDPNSPSYGQVLRTVSVPTPPGVGNEPHHMQPFIPSGCATVFAGGLFSDFWFSFDASDAARPQHTGTILPTQTSGMVPDAAFVLPNCQALATEMGGDPTTASYPGGPHGTVVRMDAAGTEVLESQAADRVPQDTVCDSQWAPVLDPTRTGGPFTRKGSDRDCLPSNPHGIWARPDLNTLVTSDYATPGLLIQPVAPPSSVAKMTVRHYALDPACTGSALPPPGTDCIGEPRVVLLPDGPRQEPNEGHEENVGVMETATTHPAGPLNPTGATPAGYLPSRGAFAATMCGGALFYTPDITVDRPQWREVFDFTTALAHLDPASEETAGCTGGGAVLLTPDNRFLLHSIIGREAGQSGALVAEGGGQDPFPGMIVLLDVRKLIQAGSAPHCNIDSVQEIRGGGAEADCPALADVHVVDDSTSGGPHFLSLDFPGGGDRLAFFNYFVEETGIKGNSDVCMLTIRGGQLIPDGDFPAAVDGQEPGRGCISFDRPDWPDDRGAGAGPAKPHYGLFHRTR